jgi:hypothetical protein
MIGNNERRSAEMPSPINPPDVGPEAQQQANELEDLLAGFIGTLEEITDRAEHGSMGCREDGAAADMALRDLPRALADSIVTMSFAFTSFEGGSHYSKWFINEFQATYSAKRARLDERKANAVGF